MNNDHILKLKYQYIFNLLFKFYRNLMQDFWNLFSSIFVKILGHFSILGIKINKYIKYNLLKRSVFTTFPWKLHTFY